MKRINKRFICASWLVLLTTVLAPLAACDDGNQGVIYDLAADLPAETSPPKDGVVDAPGDLSGQDLGLDMDLTADGDLDTGPAGDASPDLDSGSDAEAGPDLDAAVADLDLSPDAPGDLGSDAKQDTSTTDGMTDGTSTSGYKLFGEVVSGSVVSSGGNYKLISQVGHPVDTQQLTGGSYTLRLRAVATIK